MSHDRQPRGIIAIVTDKAGHVIAHEADFSSSGVGGCKLYEAQEYRAVQAVKYSTIRAYCSETLTTALDSYMFREIFERLRNHGGHNITCRAVGWGPEAQEYLDNRWRR